MLKKKIQRDKDGFLIRFSDEDCFIFSLKEGDILDLSDFIYIPEIRKEEDSELKGGLS